jgi:hypothetical protein
MNSAVPEYPSSRLIRADRFRRFVFRGARHERLGSKLAAVLSARMSPSASCGQAGASAVGPGCVKILRGI